MGALAVRDDGKTRGRAAAPSCMGFSPASINHHHCRATVRHRRPAGPILLPEHQSVAPKSGAIYFGAFEEAALRTLILAGIERRAAAANVISQIGHQASNQVPDAAEVVHVSHLSKSVASNDLEATDGENGRVPNHRGKLPDQRGELPNVSHR